MAEGIHVVLVVNDEAAHWQGYRDRLAANDGAASVSVAVPAGERRDSILAALGDKVRTVADDPAELLAAEQPQLAVITVPPLDAPPIIDAALEASAHVLAEKPASVSDTALELLARKAVQCNRHLMLAFAGSQQPAVRDAARIIRDEGRLGTLYGVTAHYIADQARIRDIEQLQRPHRFLQTPGSSRSASGAVGTCPGWASTSWTCCTSSPAMTSWRSPP